MISDNQLKEFIKSSEMLTKLNDERVFGVEIYNDTMYISEMCDEYFCLGVTSQDLIKLSEELKTLAELIKED